MGRSAPIECLVCRKHWGEVAVPGGAIYQDALVYVSHGGLWADEQEHYLGHVFVEPRRHVAELADLTDEEARTIGLYTCRVARALMKALEMEHVYSFVFGDGVPHVHVHVVGRYPGTPCDYWGVRVDEWPGARRGGETEIERGASRLRDALRR
jgi:histidine triad (HIT) family protein